MAIVFGRLLSILGPSEPVTDVSLVFVPSASFLARQRLRGRMQTKRRRIRRRTIFHLRSKTLRKW